MSVDTAAAAVERGELVVYPTETVYGLAADALDETAVGRAFAAKRRPRDRPMSLAVATVEDALEFVEATDRERACMEAFLPGPVTVLCEKRPAVPDALTAGSDRVGVRVPDHDLARRFLDRAGPVTGTSANRSGEGSVTHPRELSPSLREAVAVVLDGGETPGTESTVVDVEAGELLRRGALADDVESWLE